jgi:hypothetical protein
VVLTATHACSLLSCATPVELSRYNSGGARESRLRLRRVHAMVVYRPLSPLHLRSLICDLTRHDARAAPVLAPHPASSCVPVPISPAAHSPLLSSPPPLQLTHYRWLSGACTRAVRAREAAPILLLLPYNSLHRPRLYAIATPFFAFFFLRRPSASCATASSSKTTMASCALASGSAA